MTTGNADALGEIRKLELEMGRHLDASRESAAAQVEVARREAAAMLEAAAERGRAQAEESYEAAIRAAEAEAVQIRTRAMGRREELLEEARPYLEDAAAAVTELVLAPPEERGK